MISNLKCYFKFALHCHVFPLKSLFSGVVFLSGCQPDAAMIAANPRYFASFFTLCFGMGGIIVCQCGKKWIKVVLNGLKVV